MATVEKPLSQDDWRKRLGATTAAQAIPWINALFYGDPGAGKTYLGGTAQDHPSTGPVLVLDVEGGTATLRHRPDIDVIRVTSFQGLVDKWAELQKEKGKFPWKTVMVDSLTELQKLDMNDIMYKVLQRDPDRDPDVPSQREWGKSINHIREIVRRFRDLPCNTIFTALAQTKQDSGSGSVAVTPALPGKLANEVPGFLDIVGYLYTDVERDAVVRRLLVQPTRKYRAKDRLGALGTVIEDPTIPQIWQLIENKEKEYKNNG